MPPAVEHVAKQAKLSGDYDVRVIPRTKNFIEQLMEGVDGGSEADRKWIAAGASSSLVDRAMPLLEGLEPQRVAAIRAALQRVQLLGQEAVLVTMPEALILP